MKLPCEDITIDCTGNITKFDRNCQYNYQLSNDFNLSKILSNKDEIKCYWLDIGQLYQAQCIGTCQERVVEYYQHNVSFGVDITFEANDTEIIAVCDEYFEFDNITQKSLKDIDAIFEYVLNVAKALSRATDSGALHNILIPPDTILLPYYYGNVTDFNCDDLNQLKPLRLWTDLTLESTIKDIQTINSLFSTESF